MERWDEYLSAVSRGLHDLVVTDGTGAALTEADGFDRWLDLTRRVDAEGGRVFFIGNGASAAIASHLAADACKNAHLRAHAFNDASLLTATGNDLAFDELFSLPLSRHARAGDLLVTISSSGNSPNIVRALELARTMGVQAITLSGKGSDNRSRALGALNFYVPLPRYGWVECSHHLILHYWLDQYMHRHRQGAV